MASITQLAQMYRQRIPTAPTTGKVGPRQTTADDLRRVATYGRAGMTSTPSYQTVDPRSGGLNRTPAPGSFQITPPQLQEIQAGLIGGPAAGYGEKYGGFPTRSDFMAAIEGEAIGTRELADLARAQADQARLARSEAYTQPVAAELSRSASMAGVRPGATLSSGERAKLMGGYEDVQQFGRSPAYVERRAAESQYGPAPSWQDSANAAMRLAYEAMLEAPTVGPEDRMQRADIAVLQGLRSPSVEAYRTFTENAPTMYADIGAPEALANLIEETPLYEYARQLAVARYGMDPSQAAGLFTPEMDVNYAKQQDDYRRFQGGFMPTSTAEYIFDNYGPEAYEQYRQSQAEAALYGSPSEQRAAANFAEEAALLEADMALAEEYGFMPSAVPGYDVEDVRLVMSDPTFKQYVANGMSRITGDEYGDVAGEELGAQYFQETGDILGANILKQILVSFDVKQ